MRTRGDGLGASDSAYTLLRAWPALAPLGDPELEPLARMARRRHYPKDSHLFREGDPGLDLFLLESGEVKISRTGEGGSELVLAILGPGAAFGELAVLEEGAHRSADALALEETTCHLVERAALVTFLDSHRKALWRVISLLSAQIRRQDERAAELAFLDIPGRVARKLLELADLHGEPAAGGTRISLPISQRTLAGLIGASRENVNRALRSFAALNQVRVESGVIVVLQPEALRRRGEEA